MRKFYAFLLLSTVFGLGRAGAQTGSVTLTPPVGAPVSYTSITAAYAAIPALVTGNYLIELLTPYNGSTETYPIQLTDKGLTTGGFTITIRPAAGNTGEVIQRPVAAAGVVLQFNGADNVILDGRPGGISSSTSSYLTISDLFSGSSTNRNIELLNAANNNIVRYINSVSAEATAAAAGSRNILVGTGTATAGNNNNTITNCVVTGGLRGIQDFGLSDAVPNIGTIISNDTIRNFGAIGIFAGSSQSNITVQNNAVVLNSYNVPVTGATVSVTGIQQQSLVAGTSNILNNTISLVSTSATVSSLTAISDLGVGTENIMGNNITAMSTPSNGSLTTTNFIVAISLGLPTGAASIYNVSANKMSGLSSTGAVNFRGMSIFPANGSTLNVNNNFIAITDNNAATTAIIGALFGNTAGNNYTTNFYYNTVRIGGSESTGSTASAYGVFKDNANTGSVYNQKNNIVQMERTGGSLTSDFIGFLLNSTAGTNSVDYNTYYATDTSNGFAAGGWNGSIYRNGGLTAYKASAALQEQNSNFAVVTFVSLTDLHLAPPSSTATTLYGTPVTGATTDIDGGLRSLTTPFQGADEPGAALPVDLITFTGERKGNYNLLTWTTATELNNKGFDLERSSDGTAFKSIGFISSKADNGSSVSQLTYGFTDDKPLVVKGFYRLKQTDRDGRIFYSAVVTINGKSIMQLSITDVYPNPVSNNFNLVVNTPSESKASVAIYNVSGQAVLLQQRNLNTGKNTVPVNTASLAPGVYIITVMDVISKEKTSTRFIK